MAVCRILQQGDPMLRQVSIPVSDWRDAAPVIENLRDTLHDFQRRAGFGRGIAAVQIGAAVRVIYLEMNQRGYCLIDPVMQWHSADTFTLWDDCFSFPDLLVRVARYTAVQVCYTDESGARQTLEARGSFAELLQHELDHLDGVLALDRAVGEHSLCTREEYERRHGPR